MSENMCSCNRSRDYDALLERYEKLEQAALNLIRGISDSIEHDMVPLRCWYNANKLRLEQLGVSIDD